MYTYAMQPEPFVIGLTGNIASGKSVVLQCLANLGVLTIDADLVAQETYLPGNPAYEPILSRFGSDLALNDGQINRGKLGRIVFRDPAALGELEAMIHPLVTQKLLEIIGKTKRKVIAIEAIKLFEAGIDKHCDALWAIAASPLRCQAAPRSVLPLSCCWRRWVACTTSRMPKQPRAR